MKDGVVTAVGNGSAWIYFSCMSYTDVYGEMEVSASCKVTVDYEETIEGITDTADWEFDTETGTLYINGTGELPDNWSMTDYGYNIFQDKITNIVIDSGITYIGAYTFNYLDNLEHVYISDTVSDMNTYAFHDCAEFVWEIDENNATYCAADNVLFSYDMTKLVLYQMGKTDAEYVVPSTVTEICSYAFAYNTSLTKVILGENIEIINNGAFRECTALEEIVIDKKLTTIGFYSFEGCPYMKIYYYGNEDDWGAVFIDSTSGLYYSIKCNYVPTVNENGYAYYVKDSKAYIVEYTSPITTDTFTIASTLGGYPVVAIEDRAFPYEESVIGEFIIPEGIEEIGHYLFSERNIQKLRLPATLKKIGNHALSCMALEEITISENNSNFCSVDGVLFNKEQTAIIRYPAAKAGISYQLPDGVQMISRNSFVYCDNLESVDLGGDVTYIGYFAFEGCMNLKTITMPAGITNIQSGAFGYSDSITDVYYAGTQDCWNTIDIAYGNDPLTSATIHYGTEPAPPVSVKMGAMDYNNNRFYFDVYFNGVESGKTAVIAYYYKNKLVYTDDQPYNGEAYLSFARSYDLGTIDCVKAMVWDDFGGLQPVCKTAEYLIEAD